MTQEPISPAQRGFWSRFLSRGFWIVLFGAVFLFVGYRLAFPNAARPAGPSSGPEALPLARAPWSLQGSGGTRSV